MGEKAKQENSKADGQNADHARRSNLTESEVVECGEGDRIKGFIAAQRDPAVETKGSVRMERACVDVERSGDSFSRYEIVGRAQVTRACWW